MYGDAVDVSRNKFLFSQISENILEHEDEDGNKFAVSKLGKCTTTINNEISSRNKVKFYQIDKIFKVLYLKK
jgi:hypothetical protein